ncbi:V-snare-domain-containing protein [Tilletiaria anomala UBC 951]|uniref:V-snare-domain-containing protein n=1 Tax=Tilletiaria anomala (strain ATCC 24038 / CBS 436.72 / UBC 951) TaxID=1037660 RepID=A0A066WQI8_TILAU|nr:V-snare-domain-containing protein [Tilletiaria anomala UBC 951]KDN53279.1 V-snare-domain-containing protein [Tilletiaria anomala UBC 951]
MSRSSSTFGGGASSSTSRWDTARRQTRLLESSLDAKLTLYSRVPNEIASLSAGGGHGDGSSSSIYGAYGGNKRDFTSVSMDGANGDSRIDPQLQEAEIENLLVELTASVDSLTTLLDDPSVPPSTVQMHAVQRHREVLLDFQRDYRRLKTNVQHAVDRRDLLGNVQHDIDSYKARYTSDTDALLTERSRLDNSHSIIDSTLDQAYATRQDIAAQRDLIGSIASRMTRTAQSLPGINGVITMINRRRRRDSIIMGLTIGICTVLILMYMTSGW